MEIDIEELFRLYNKEVETIESFDPGTRLDSLWNACCPRASSCMVTVMSALSGMFLIDSLRIEPGMTRLPLLKRVSDISTAEFDNEDLCRIIKSIAKDDGQQRVKKYVGIVDPRFTEKSDRVIWVDDDVMTAALALIWTIFKMDIQNVKEVVCDPGKLNKCLPIFGRCMAIGEWRWSGKGGGMMGVVRVHPGTFSVSEMQRLPDRTGYSEVKTTHFMRNTFGIDSIRAAVDNPELKDALEALVKKPRSK